MEHPLSLVAPRTLLDPASGVALRLACSDWHAFESAEAIAAWDRLASRVDEPNPFHESWYLLPSLRAFDPQGSARILTLEADGELVGLLPLRRENRYYGHPLPHWRGWQHENTFLGSPLVAPGFERAFWRGLLDWADRQGGLALFLHLARMPLDGALHEALRAETASRPAATVWREQRAMLCSDLSPDDYLATSLTGKKRKELRRQQRRLGEEGNLAMVRHTDDADIAAWAEAFLALEARGWKGAAGSALAADPRTARLFTDALAGAAARGRLERLGLWLGDKPIAMLASFITPPAAFSFKTAFDEDYARFSPGVLLQEANLAILERSDIAFSDSCAAPDHAMIDHFWRERRPVGHYSIAIGGPLRRAVFSLLSRREQGATPAGIA